MALSFSSEKTKKRRNDKPSLGRRPIKVLLPRCIHRSYLFGVPNRSLSIKDLVLKYLIMVIIKFCLMPHDLMWYGRLKTLSLCSLCNYTKYLTAQPGAISIATGGLSKNLLSAINKYAFRVLISKPVTGFRKIHHQTRHWSDILFDKIKKK